MDCRDLIISRHQMMSHVSHMIRRNTAESMLDNSF